MPLMESGFHKTEGDSDETSLVPQEVMLNPTGFNIVGGPKLDVFLFSLWGSFSKPITPLMGGIRNTLRFNPPIMEG